MLKFSASVLSGETPVNDGGSLVTLMFQRRDLSLQYHLVADSTVETLVAEDAQLYLSHVQPTAVYWSSRRLAMRRASAGLKASYNEPSL